MCVFQCMRVLCGGSGVWIISPWVLFREASRAWGGEEKGDIVVVQMNVIGASENRFTHGGFSRNKLATSAWPLRLWPCLNPFYEGIKCINCHGLASVCRLLLIGVRSQRKKRQCIKSVLVWSPNETLWLTVKFLSLVVFVFIFCHLLQNPVVW